MRRNTKRQLQSLLKPFILVAVFLIIVGFITFRSRLKSESTPNTTKSTTPSSSNTADSPIPANTPNMSDTSETTPTQPGENQPPESNEKPGVTVPSTTQSSTGKIQVTPVISYLDYSDSSKQELEVDAWVPGINEISGQCVLVATSGPHTITKQNPATSNVQSMSCKNFLIDKSEFAAAYGSWQFTVRYSSSKAEGSSISREFKVQ